MVVVNKKYIVSIFLLLLMGCATSSPKNQRNIDNIDYASKYEYNNKWAHSIVETCNSDIKNKTVDELMIYTKGYIHNAIEVNLNQMQQISLFWQNAIARNVYLDEESPSIQLSNFMLDLSREGITLVSTSVNECALNCMQNVKALGGETKSGFNDLMEYYSLYTQMYNLANNPSGSLISYNQAIENFKLEKTRLSSKLDIILH